MTNMYINISPSPLSYFCCLDLLLLLPTFPPSSAPYGTFSNAPLNAPSESPPRRSCRIWPASVWTSAAEMGVIAGVRVVRSKLDEDSGSRASMSIVRQLMSMLLRAPAMDMMVVVAVVVLVYECYGFRFNA